VLFTDEHVVAFHDITPRAPVHVLVIPRRHVASLDAARAEDQALLGEVLLACQRAARETGIVNGGFRVVSNCGTGAGQSVFHLHFHVLGGRPLGWPPG
jgi:histidine triad (HIT) family protein